MNGIMPANANRRQILLGLAAASAVAASGSRAESGPAENPELLRLTDALPGLRSEHVAARDHAARIYRSAHARWPRAPEEIHSFFSGDLERDVAGAAIIWPGDDKPKRVATPAYFQSVSEKHRRESLRISKFKRVSARRIAWEQEQHAKALSAVPLAEVYWQEITCIKSQCGYDAAAAKCSTAVAALKANVSAIMAETETSMAGLVIKAQALTAWAEVGQLYRTFNADGPDWADQIAASIIRQGDHGALSSPAREG